MFRFRRIIPDLLRLLVLLATCSILSSTNLRAAPPSYADELVAAAHARRLADEREWLRLGHYQPNHLVGGVHSLVDDPAFFFAATGKDDPAAELEATLRAFFSNETETAEKQHPQCAFPARFHYLDRELGFDEKKLPRQSCLRFREWQDSLNAASVTLVYPAAYLNNPASMFGHTLIRIDAKGQTDETRLLAYGASYAAATTERSGLVFAVRGIFGGYRGVFSISPYYKMVAKYSDLENRDIWEYELALTSEQVAQLIRHLWELGSVYFDYFFFDENCAYHLLSLLEAVRPELNLTEQFPRWAIPSDTVRAVTEVPGLVARAIFRPANSTVIRARLAQLSPEHQTLALEIAKGEVSSEAPEVRALPDLERARVLELSFEYLNYRRLRGKPLEEVPKRATALLRERSAVPVELEPVHPELPALRPEEGHATARLSLGGGVEDGEEYYELGYRPAYHDLLDAPGGYVRGADLRFFDLALRHYEGDELELEKLRPLSIVSLVPRSEFFQSLSWKVGFGAERESLPGFRRGALAYGAGGGAGCTYALSPDLIFSTLLETSLEYNPDYPEEEYALGAGPSLTLLWSVGEDFGLLLSGQSLHSFLGEEHREQEVRIEQRTNLTRDISARAAYVHRYSFGDYENELQVSLNLYF